ncbi:hypothetical protein EV363DRAFT_1445728 [Boletus edulis]|uniref:Uncharacterized protein n=1 Tax=Boletus edulis BED1 TaxID=1328754 RepID=A0AAD4BQA9_BOLED|nr:hypothetical protein EV363DRAFT_1445728 [Boletus edulis]KAF8437300.1 hypothetical protein L210DRAFT_3647592 [Boletus edulis BED1]
MAHVRFTAPSKIRITVPNGQWMISTIEKVVDHVERIQELDLGFPVVYPHTIHPPRLQYLKISMRDPLPKQSFALFDRNTSPPYPRSLKLSDAITLLESGNQPSPDLNLSGEGRFPYNMEKFLAVLRCTTKSLSHLHLEHVFPSCRGFIYSATFDVFQKIKLPHLSRLCITAPVSAVVAVLHKFSIEGRSLPSLWVRRPSIDDDNYTLLASVLAHRYSGSEDHESSILTIRSLDMEFAMQGSRLICCSQLEHIGDSCPSTGHMVIGFDFPLRRASQNLRVALIRVISDICCSIPLKHLQSLRIIKPPTSQDFWTRILGHLQGLRYITLSEGNMHRISFLDLAGITARTTRTDTPIEVEVRLSRGRSWSWIRTHCLSTTRSCPTESPTHSEYSD